MRLIASQSLEKLPLAEEPQPLYPRKVLSGSLVLCPVLADQWREDAVIGPL